MIAQSIDRPRHHDIELAPRSIAVQPVKGRPLVAPFGAADAVVGVDLDDGVAHALGSSAQLALLNRKSLKLSPLIFRRCPS